MVQGLLGRGRLQGDQPQYPPNAMPPPRRNAMANIIGLEDPIIGLICDMSRGIRRMSMNSSFHCRMSLNRELRDQYQFNLMYPNNHIVYDEFNNDEDNDQMDGDDD
jgi:hypothetical protein